MMGELINYGSLLNVFKAFEKLFKILGLKNN